MATYKDLGITNYIDTQKIWNAVFDPSNSAITGTFVEDDSASGSGTKKDSKMNIPSYNIPKSTPVKFSDSSSDSGGKEFLTKLQAAKTFKVAIPKALKSNVTLNSPTRARVSPNIRVMPGTLGSLGR